MALVRFARAFAVIVCLFMASGLLAQANQPLNIQPHMRFGATVLSVGDGDTVKVRLENGETRKVRFLHIDTPETHFQGLSQGAGGEEAHAFLLTLLPIGTKIEIQVGRKPTDAYKRILGVIHSNGKNVNLEMIRAGFAVGLYFAPNVDEIEPYREATIKHIREKTGVFFGPAQTQIPSEFRATQGSHEAPYVGDLTTGEVLPFAERARVAIENRVLFGSEKSKQKHAQLIAPDCDKRLRASGAL